jgi:Tfp pilus assembly protein PilO
MIKTILEHPLAKKVKEIIEGLDRKVLIQIAVIIVTLVVFIAAFFLPVLMQNKKSIREVKKLKMMIQGAKIKVGRLPEMKKQKEMFGARLKEGRLKFFEPEEVDQIIKVISQTASEANIRISASKPSDKAIELTPPFGQLYVAASYELSIEGTYDSIALFINGLERYQKTFLVSDLRISKGQTNKMEHQCGLVISAFLKRSKVEVRGK